MFVCKVDEKKLFNSGKDCNCGIFRKSYGKCESCDKEDHCVDHICYKNAEQKESK